MVQSLWSIYLKIAVTGKLPTVALREAQLQLWQSKEWQSPYWRRSLCRVTGNKQHQLLLNHS
ncbi:hypothetical protein NIES2101_43695 [Calothrix sp. HK-06]|nr:hypothetical protein NIES2101_43695 [Calothrix sp. HK-06]